MTNYVRKPNYFDELEITSLTTKQNITDFLGNPVYYYDDQISTLLQDVDGSFYLWTNMGVMNGKRQEEASYLTFAVGSYIRAERRPSDGGILNIIVGDVYSMSGALASDDNFEVQ